MEDHAQLLRADNRRDPMIRVKTVSDSARSKGSVNKRSTTILACLVCAFLSFLLGVTVGHAWRGNYSPLSVGRTVTNGVPMDASASASTNGNPSANTNTTTSVAVNQTALAAVPTTASECPTPPPCELKCPTPPPCELKCTPVPTVVASSTTPPAPRTMTKPRRKTIVFLGDSVTMAASDASKPGFALRLSGEYTRSGDVFNRGITTYNTKGFLSAAIPVLEDEMATWLTPSVVVIWFGVNDATVIGGRYQSQHVPVDKYKKNLIEMVTRLQTAAPSVKILLVTPLTVDNSRAVDRTNEATGIYAAACREVLDSVKNVALLDMYSYMMDRFPNATDRGQLQEDGLHLNSEGHKVVYELFKREIQKLLPGFNAQQLQVPDWDSLNDKYPANVQV